MSLFNKFAASIFAVSLAKKFTDWEAFKLGLIDAKGKLLKTPKTIPEKKALTPLKNLVRKVKQVIIKFVPDNKYLGALITAYLLKKESIGFEQILNEKLTSEEIENLNEILSHISTDSDFTNLLK